MTDTIYRSSHPDVLAAWEAQNAEWLAYQDRRDAQMTAWGFAERPIYVTSSPFGDRIAGVASDTYREVPPQGWRRERGKNYFVPARSTKAGKVIAKEFDAIACIPNARKALEPFGMPTQLFVGLRITSYAATVRDGVLWVRWRDADPEARNQDPEYPSNDTEPQFSREHWERVKLSDFYALVESGEDPFAEDRAA